jgi:hypothetical protein
MAPTSDSRLRYVGLLIILLVALTTRLWGINWQLPSALYFDELKYVGWAGDARDDANAEVTDLRNPTFFHHLLQAEYAVAALARRDATPRERAVFELWLARVTSAVLGALACLATALAASALVRAAGGLSRGVAAAGAVRQDAAWSGLAAGLIVALAPLHVHLSHYAVNDATASLFLALTLLFGCRALTSADRRDLLFAGVMAGLAFGTKYSFAVGLLLPLAAAARVCRTHATPVTLPAAPTPDSLPPAGGGLGRGSILALLVLFGFVLGAVVGAPELLLRPQDVVAGIAEQARIGASRWNGQSDAPIWQLYAETLVQGLGWPAVLAAGIGTVVLGWRQWGVLVAVLTVPLVCLSVMLRQELFFARFALPLLSPLAMLAGLGVVALTRLGISSRRPRTARVRTMELAAIAAILGVILLPEAVTTIRHNQLATTTDTRVLARRWLRQRGDGARVVSEVYGQPLLWTGSEAARGFRLLRVSSLVDAAAVTRYACDGNRVFLVASLTAERELARRGPRTRESGYDLLARQGRVLTTFDPFVPGMSAPAHPDNTGIPFWYLEAYARPGPTITVYELSEEAISCRH